MDLLRRVILWTILVIWVVSWIAGFVAATDIVPGFEYQPDPAVNGIFTVIIGSLFAVDTVKSLREKEKVSKGEDTDEK